MPGSRRLPRATPESCGLPSGAVTSFLDAVQAQGQELHSVMVVVRGAVVAEGWWAPYEAGRRHELFSLSKSFTSTAVGLAQSEGLLSVDDLVLSHLPEHAPAEPDPRLARMRIRHLLTMTTGHDVDTSDRVFSRPDWTRAFLALPVEHEPGTHFVYNTAATYLLSAIVTTVTGQRLLDYLGPRVLEPLGITGATWQQSPQGVDAGGYGLAVTTEDVACFGQLYLRDGVWQGRRLLPEGWVAQASRVQTPSRHSDDDVDWVQGYGYQFWRGRHGTYRGDGAFGQYALVLPDQDAVVAITSGSGDMQGVLDLVWDHLLTAMAVDPHGVLDPDPTAQAGLAERLADLRLEPPRGAATSPVARAWAGRTIDLDANPFGIRSAVIEPGADRTTIAFDGADGPFVLEAGHGVWVPGCVPPAEDPATYFDLIPPADPTRPDRSQPVVTAVAWPRPDTMVMAVRLVESSFMLTLTATFDGARVRVRADLNAWFGPTHLGEVLGTAVAPAPAAVPPAPTGPGG